MSLGGNNKILHKIDSFCRFIGMVNIIVLIGAIIGIILLFVTDLEHPNG